jgi:hypothetical protein
VAQSESTPHATQESVAESQTLSVPVQSLAEAQPTHAPRFVSHTGVALGQSEFSVHGPWHAWSPGQHLGAAAEQSEFTAQAAHCPVLVTQIGSGSAQSVDVRHSTQPSEGLHCSLPPH